VSFEDATQQPAALEAGADEQEKEE
jgi:hypothetical protein